MNTVFLDKQGNVRKPETWAEVKEAICKMWDSCKPCPNRGGHSRTEGGFECHHPLCPHESVNPVIVQLKKELAEARDNEIMAQQLGHNTDRWISYQNGLHRAVQIVEKMK